MLNDLNKETAKTVYVYFVSLFSLQE